MRGDKADAHRIPRLAAPCDDNGSAHRFILLAEHPRMRHVIRACTVRVVMQLTLRGRLLKAIFECDRAERPVGARVNYRGMQLTVAREHERELRRLGLHKPEREQQLTVRCIGYPHKRCRNALHISLP